jgi:hypothetical protein
VWNAVHSVHLNVSDATVATAKILATCVTNKREREKNTTAKEMAGLAARLPLYPLEVTQR